MRRVGSTFLKFYLKEGIKMIELVKDGKTIRATQKAYEVIYKSDGYKIKGQEEPDQLGYEDITVAEIKDILDKDGVEYNEKDTKPVLFDLLRGDKDETDK